MDLKTSHYSGSGKLCLDYLGKKESLKLNVGID